MERGDSRQCSVYKRTEVQLTSGLEPSLGQHGLRLREQPRQGQVQSEDTWHPAVLAVQPSLLRPCFRNRLISLPKPSGTLQPHCARKSNPIRERLYPERQEGNGLTITALTRGTMMGTGGGQLLIHSPESHSRRVSTVLTGSQAGPNCDVSSQQDTGIRDVVGPFTLGQVPIG